MNIFSNNFFSLNNLFSLYLLSSYEMFVFSSIHAQSRKTNKLFLLLSRLFANYRSVGFSSQIVICLSKQSLWNLCAWKNSCHRCLPRWNLSWALAKFSKALGPLDPLTAIANSHTMHHRAENSFEISSNSGGAASLFFLVAATWRGDGDPDTFLRSRNLFDGSYFFCRKFVKLTKSVTHDSLFGYPNLLGMVFFWFELL